METLLTAWVVALLFVAGWSLYRMGIVTSRRKKLKNEVFSKFHEDVYRINEMILCCDGFEDIDTVINEIIDFEATYSKYDNRIVEKEMIHSYITRFNEKLDEVEESKLWVYHCVI